MHEDARLQSRMATKIAELPGDRLAAPGVDDMKRLLQDRP